MDKFGVEDTVFCEVDITTFYNCTRSLLQTAKFAHMNGHWKDYNFSLGILHVQKSNVWNNFSGQIIHTIRFGEDVAEVCCTD